MSRSQPRISIAISAHGYGHLTQAMAVVTSLLEQQQGIILRIQSNHPRELIAQRLPGHDFDYENFKLDIGLIHRDPLTPDLEATYQAYSSLHDTLEEAIEAESRKLKEWSAELVISDIAYLSLAAAARAGIPGIAIASLSWDHVIKAYYDLDKPGPARWYRQMCAAYGKTTLALLPEPALPPISFNETRRIPPIVTRGQPIPGVRQELGINEEDPRPLVMCSLGGIPAATLPLAAMRAAAGFHWLVDYGQLPAADNLHALAKLHAWPYKDIIASADGVVSKPGYGMAVEAAAYGLPIVFTRRGHFPDEEVIANWLRQNARTIELSNEDWFSGKFVAALEDLFQSTPAKIPACDGAEVAASIIRQYL